jgi:hypothetical protein
MAISTENGPLFGGNSIIEIETLIKAALRKTGRQNELDLCEYIPYGEGVLSSATYLQLKDTDRGVLKDLILRNIMNPASCENLIETMKITSRLSYTGPSLEECIRKAMSKLNIERETVLCMYIPYGKGHLHHFTYLKMKQANPIQLRNLLLDHVLSRSPERLPPMQRRKKRETRENFTPKTDEVARGSAISASKENVRVRKDTHDSKIDLLFDSIDRLIHAIEEKDVVKSQHLRSQVQSSPKIYEKPLEKCLQIIQTDLIGKILRREVDQQLWNIYVELSEAIKH